MYRNYPRKKFLRKPNLLKTQECLGINQGLAQEKQTKGYPNMNFENAVTNVEFV